jgi:hypothetical protein
MPLQRLLLKAMVAHFQSLVVRSREAPRPSSVQVRLRVDGVAFLETLDANCILMNEAEWSNVPEMPSVPVDVTALWITSAPEAAVRI